MTFKAVSYGVVIAGGLLLTVAPFVGSGRAAPRWARLAYWLSGPAAVLWGILGSAALFGSGARPDLVAHFRAVLGGMAIGILILLVASGELRTPRKSGTNQDRVS